MAFQNRVTPHGEIITTPERGMFMGNRGRIHDAHKQITKKWARNTWVTCSLLFNNRHREIMSSESYTELFFLDEVTSLAAGHRPCGTCRNEDSKRFKSLWLSSNPILAAISGTSMAKIDKELHSERVDSNRKKKVWFTTIGELPDGTMIEQENLPKLIWKGYLYNWTSGGYTEHQILQPGMNVKVLTPPSFVNVLKMGYIPMVHPTVKS